MIKSVTEVNQYLKACVYAKNKVGKTRWAVSSNLRTLIIDCEEKGSETVVGLPNQANVDVYELGRWEEFNWMFWHLKANKHPYEVVVIDTVTMLSALCLKWIMGDERSRDTNLDPLMPSQRHYGKLNMTLGQSIIDWRNLPMHVIFLAQERTEMTQEDGDAEAQVLEVVPSLTKGPRGTLMSAVGTIGRLYTKDVTTTVKGKEVTKTERRMLVGAHETFAAGTRIRGLPRVIRNPTLGALLEHRATYGELPVGESDPNTSLEI
jgi:phage nucleotide-binding protein